MLEVMMVRFPFPFKKKNNVASVSKSDAKSEVLDGEESKKKGLDRNAIKKKLTAKNVSFGIVVLVCLYLVLMPFVPLIPYYYREIMGLNEYHPAQTVVDGSSSAREGVENDSDAVPDVNTVRIPAVGIDVAIVEGTSDKSLDKGAWHRPGTGDPESGSNMVITGHRFKYLPPSNLTFYHLDKVVLGDRVIVYWNGKRYDYEVSKIHVVTPDRIEVESPTAGHQLTLYTCTPLWTAKLRLVIVALPVSPDEDTQEETEEGSDDELPNSSEE